MKLKIRILSMLLVFCTILSVMPMEALATERTYSEIYFESNGGLECNSISVLKGATVDYLPIPQKANYIFMGWYTTSDFKEGTVFTKDSQVTDDTLTLYAKYFNIDNPEESTNINYTMNDQDSNLSFRIQATEDLSVEDVKNHISLSCMDGSNSINLAVSKENGGYSIAAENGFKKGSGYILNLEDDKLFFEGQEKTVRSCSFSIKKDAVNTLEYHEEIIFIKDTDIAIAADKKEELFSPLISVDENSDSVKKNVSGDFTYNGTEILEAGNIICIYTGEKPNLQDNDINSDDAIAYLKVSNIAGNKISYVEPELYEILYMPELIPYNVDGQDIQKIDAQGNAGCLMGSSSAFNVDEGAYQEVYDELYGMDYNDAATPTLDEGDYIVLFQNTALSDVTDAEMETASYGKITDIEMEDGIVKVLFQEASKAEYDSQFDLYQSCDITSEEIMSDEEKIALQKQIEQQVADSEFYDKAATYLTNVAMATDGFQKEVIQENLTQCISQIQQSTWNTSTLSRGGNATGSNKVHITNKKVTAKISDAIKLEGGDKRCEVTLSFDVVMGSGENQLVIHISATFEEEIGLSYTSRGSRDGGTFKFGFDFEVKNYTGFSLESTMQTKENSEQIDIAKEMKDLMDALDEEESTAGIGTLSEEYHNLLQNETDFISLIDKKFVSIKVPIIQGVLEADFYANFVVSANVNVALGCGFNYQNGKEYSFTTTVNLGIEPSVKCESNQRQTLDEVFEFDFYCMGTIELRAGIKVGIDVGVISTEIASVGFSVEVGAYTKLYGLFYYTYVQINGEGSSSFTGNMLIELGIYLSIDFNYKFLVFGGSQSLYDTEFPLLTVGSRYMMSNPSIGGDSDYKLYSVDYARIDELASADKLDMQTGITQKYQLLDSTDFTYETTDPRVTIEYTQKRIPGTGIYFPFGHYIVVNPGAGEHEIEADVIMTLKNSGLTSTPYSKTLHVYWTDYTTNSSTFKFNSNGGNYINPVRVILDAQTGEVERIDGELKKPQDPVRYGYIFEGWYVDAECTTPYDFTNMKEEAISRGGKYQGFYERNLYAKWSDGPVYYDLTYVLEDKGQIEYTVNSVPRNTTVHIDDLNRYFEGYELDKERSSKDITITEYTAYDEADKLPLTLYYNKKQHNVTYQSNGGSIITHEGQKDTYGCDYKYGTKLFAPTVMRTGYTFDGWKDENGEDLPTTMPDHDVTVSAQWKINSYTVTFSGTDITQNVTYNEPLTPPTIDMDKDGYTFLGWFTNKYGIHAFDFTNDRITKDTVLYPKWQAKAKKEYTVYHYSAGNLTQEEIDNNMYTKEELLEKGCVELGTDKLWSGGKILTPQVKQFDGYDSPLAHSFMVEDGKEPVLRYFYTTKIGGSLITFDANGGGGGTEHYCASEEELKQVTAPTVTKEGFIFAGWSNKLSEAQFGQNMVLQARWKPDNYVTDDNEVEYTVNGTSSTGSLTSAIEVANSGGDAVEITLLKDIVTDSGYIVTGNVTINGNGQSIYTTQQGILLDGSDNSADSYIGLFGVESPDTEGITACLILRNLDLFGGCVPVISNNDKIIMEQVSIHRSGSMDESKASTIISNSGICIMKQCNIQDCKVRSYMGGIYNYGTLVMEHCSLVDIECSGALISNNQSASVEMNNCTIANNKVNNVIFSASMSNSVVMNSTIVGNEANGIFGFDSSMSEQLHLSNSIIADNYTYNDAAAKYTSSTFSNETDRVLIHHSNYKATSLGNSDTLESFDGTTLFQGYHLAENQAVKIPYLTKLDNGTYAPLLAPSSPALTGGRTTFFSYDEAAMDGDTLNKSMYFKAGDNEIFPVDGFSGTKTQVTTYQNTQERSQDVIGTIGTTK